MKNFVLSIICALTLVSVAHAKGRGNDFAIGFHLLNGSALNQMGIGVKVECDIADQLRLAPSFNYFFEKNSTSAWDLGVNLNYVVNVTSNFDVYPLVGVGFIRFTDDLGGGVSTDHDRVFANLGLGADIAVTKEIWLTTELRYQYIDDYGQFVPSVGVKFCF